MRVRRRAVPRALFACRARLWAACRALPADQRTAVVLRYYEQLDYDEIAAQLKEQIGIGLVGLFVARSRCSRIDVTIVSDPPQDRLELFDDCAWITLYSNTAGVPRPYPRTLRFTESSFLYAMERAEFLRISNSKAGYHFVITPGTTRTDFLALFEKITGETLTKDGFAELEEKFHAFRREFSASACMPGGGGVGFPHI